VADWGGGMSASCKPWVQLLADAGNGWPHSVISSCQSAATSQIVKCFWSRTHVRSAITSIVTSTEIIAKKRTSYCTNAFCYKVKYISIIKLIVYLFVLGNYGY